MYDDTDPSIPLVRLIGGLSLHYGGRRMALPPGSHRLLAYLAPAPRPGWTAAAPPGPLAHRRRRPRRRQPAVGAVAAQQVGCPLVRAEQSIARPRARASRSTSPGSRRGPTRVLAGTAAPDDLAVDPAPIAELELLPGWYDDWVLAVRERLHLRLLHALEAAEPAAAAAGRPVAARGGGARRRAAEPLRESGSGR